MREEQVSAVNVNDIKLPAHNFHVLDNSDVITLIYRRTRKESKHENVRKKDKEMRRINRFIAVIH